MTASHSMCRLDRTRRRAIAARCLSGLTLLLSLVPAAAQDIDLPPALPPLDAYPDNPTDIPGGWAQPVETLPAGPVTFTDPAAEAPPPGHIPWRPWQRKTAVNLPSDVIADPQYGTLRVAIIGGPESTCDPILYGLWLGEFQSALNSTPRFRVVDAGLPPPAPCPIPNGATVGWGRPPPISALTPVDAAVVASDVTLRVSVRSIDPYRPMRIDARLELVEATSGAPLARLDGVWKAPVDGVPLRPTRVGWFRRAWQPAPAISEAAALEANSPRMFLRGTAQRMAGSLSGEVSKAYCTTGSDLSAP